MKKLCFALFIVLCNPFVINAQDSLYARKVIQKLTSPSFAGRGYVHHGDEKAAAWIEKEYRKIGIRPLSASYRQPFAFPVNTFPGKLTVCINENHLVPGKDYITGASDPSLKGKFKIEKADRLPSQYRITDDHVFFLVDTLNNPGLQGAEGLKQWMEHPPHCKGIIFIKEKLTWTVSREQDELFRLFILRGSAPANSRDITINCKSRFVKLHVAKNIAGYIEGVHTDSFLVVTAHYDHLGKMGKALFPGANDNASGTAMLLCLAKWFSAQKPNYTVLFIAFAGEEAGLVGSHYYTEHPLTSLERIRFLVNLDLLGTGNEGLMVVNATLFPAKFALLDSLNKLHHYLPEIKQRGTAKNSDHYYFSEKGVPAFFCYTLGGVSFYHDIYDREETLPLTKFSEVLNLLKDFFALL